MALYADEEDTALGEETSPQARAASGRPATGAAKRAKQAEAAKRRKERQLSAMAQQTEKPGAPRPRTISVKATDGEEEQEGTPAEPEAAAAEEPAKSPSSPPPEYHERAQPEEKPAEPAAAATATSPRKKHSHSHHSKTKPDAETGHGHGHSHRSKAKEQLKPQNPEPETVAVATVTAAAAAAPEEPAEEKKKKKGETEVTPIEPVDSKSELERRGIAATYDPLAEDSKKAPAPATTTAAVVAMARPAKVTVSASDSFVVDPRSLDLTSADLMREFINRPGERGRYIQCKIQRMSKVYSTYFVFLEETNQFLLSARKRKRSASSNYLISLDQSDLARASPAFVGKVRSNFLGTEFVVYDNGVNPKKLDKKKRSGSSGQVESVAEARHELAAVTYGTNVLGLQGPRKMVVLVPRVGADGRMLDNQPLTREQTLLERFREGGDAASSVMQMHNKSPSWNDETQSYVLNFRKRVKLPSVKNFQVVSPSDPEEVLMQFGRITEFTFAMDYQYPLTLLQAFGIALSSFDTKLACD